MAVLNAVGDATKVPVGLVTALAEKAAPCVAPVEEDALRLPCADTTVEIVGAPEEDGTPLRELKEEAEALREGRAVALSTGERDAEKDARGDGEGGGEGEDEGERFIVAVSGADREKSAVADAAAVEVAVGTEGGVVVAEAAADAVPPTGERLGEPEAEGEAVSLGEALLLGEAPIVGVAPLCVPQEDGVAPAPPEGVFAAPEKLPSDDGEKARDVRSRGLSLGAEADGGSVRDAAALPHADTLPPMGLPEAVKDTKVAPPVALMEPLAQGLALMLKPTVDEARGDALWDREAAAECVGRSGLPEGAPVRVPPKPSVVAVPGALAEAQLEPRGDSEASVEADPAPPPPLMEAPLLTDGAPVWVALTEAEGEGRALRLARELPLPLAVVVSDCEGLVEARAEAVRPDDGLAGAVGAPLCVAGGDGLTEALPAGVALAASV